MQKTYNTTMIFDLHCDTIWKIDESERSGTKPISLRKNKLQIDEEKLKKGKYFAQCFAVYIPNKYEDCYQRCLNAIAIFQREIEKSKLLSPVHRYGDFKKNKANCRVSAILTMEDGCPIGKDLKRLQFFYELGVRMICLTHNYVNEIGYPNLCENRETSVPAPSQPNTKDGLTEFGRELVLTMNKLGIIVDTSHLSDKGFYDAIKISEKPIVASHSNARGLCTHIRNLTDDMLFKLADNGGVMGINYAKQFLHNTPSLGEKTVECVVAHMKYIKKKIGVEHIALGSDFDGIDENIELCDCSKLGKLIVALRKENFTDSEIKKITYQNALRVFRANLV